MNRPSRSLPLPRTAALLTTFLTATLLSTLLPASIVILGASVSSTASAQTLTEARRVRIARRLARSTVSVIVGEGSGSGFIVGDERWVITNHHVVAASTEAARLGHRPIPVQIRFGSGTTLSARVLEDDAHHDLALLEVEGRVVAPALELTDSDDVEVGQTVLAFGSPFGLDGTLTEGIVSARRDIADVGGGSARRLIQTDAPINPGNSGGPLVDARGRVVGVNTAIIGRSSAGIGFAVPANYVRDLVTLVRDRGGVASADAAVTTTGGPSTPGGEPDADLPVAFGVIGSDFSGGGTSGVRVDRTVAGSPAQRAGILGSEDPAPAMITRMRVIWTGHIITAIDGNPIANVGEMHAYLAARVPGDVVRLSVTVGPGVISAERNVRLDAPAP